MMKTFKITFLLFLLISFSCTKKTNSCPDTINALSKAYINWFRSDSPSLQDEVFFVLRQEDIEDSNLEIYRFCAEPKYLAESMLPDSIKVMKGEMVLYYLLTEVDETQKEEVYSFLSERGLISDKAYMITSNYSEWVLIKDQQNNRQFLYKDTHYRSIEVILSQEGGQSFQNCP